MLILSICTLVGALLFAIAAWLKGRPRSWVFPSDALFLSCVTFVGLPPLLNLRATTAFSVKYAYDDTVIARTLFAISMMFGIFGLVWMLRPAIRTPSIMHNAADGRGMGRSVFIGMLVLCVLSVALMALLPSYRNFRVEILQFLMGSLYEGDYQYARRFAYNDNFLISQLVSRLRYSGFAFVFAVSAAYLFKTTKNRALAFGILAVAYFLLPSSLSKLPVVVFLAYAVLAFSLVGGGGKILLAKRMIPSLAITMIVVVLLLTGLYKIQYPNVFSGLEGWLTALDVAIYRFFGATYDALLQYFTVYPKVYDFTHGTESWILASLSGKPVREVIMEVPTYFLGSETWGVTTTPTIFIGGAYASLGYFGVIVSSVIVAVFAVWVDMMVPKLRNGYIRAAVYATLMLNLVFFAMTAAQTVFLTYGCGIIPVLGLFCDGWLAKRKKRQAGVRPGPARIPSRYAKMPGAGPEGESV